VVKEVHGLLTNPRGGVVLFVIDVRTAVPAEETIGAVSASAGREVRNRARVRASWLDVTCVDVVNNVVGERSCGTCMGYGRKGGNFSTTACRPESNIGRITFHVQHRERVG